MKISLYQYSPKGAAASIESGGEFNTLIIIAKGITYSAPKACELAAQRLREMANRFDQLAKEKEPFHRETQARINRTIDRISPITTHKDILVIEKEISAQGKLTGKPIILSWQRFEEK